MARKLRNYQTQIQIYGRLLALARSKQDFTTTELRTAVGYSEASPEAAALHNLIAALKSKGVVEKGGPPRRRHQKLFVDPEMIPELQRLASRAARLAGNGNGQTSAKIPTESSSTPQRVLFMEERLALLEKTATSKADGASAEDLTALATKVEALTVKVDELVKLWS